MLLNDVEHPELMSGTLFPPLLMSTAQGDTGRPEVTNRKKQRCIPFGLSLTIVSGLFADLKGKGFFLLFTFLFLGTSQLLLKSIHAAFHLL